MVRRYSNGLNRPFRGSKCCKDVQRMRYWFDRFRMCSNKCKVVRSCAKWVRSIRNRFEVSEISFGGQNKLRKSEIKSENVFVMFGGMFKAIIEVLSELGWQGDPITVSHTYLSVCSRQLWPAWVSHHLVIPYSAVAHPHRSGCCILHFGIFT